jgi:hypothetical protein
MEAKSLGLGFNSSAGFGLTAMTNGVLTEWLMEDWGSLGPLLGVQQSDSQAQPGLLASPPTGLASLRQAEGLGWRRGKEQTPFELCPS